MYKRILIASDGSELATKAVTHGVALAKDLNVPICAVTVTEAWSAFDIARMAKMGSQNPITQYEDMATSAAMNILDKVAQVASSQNVTYELVHVQDQHPAEGHDC
jgi:nucleotide-binding universal stress UspA family protein